MASRCQRETEWAKESALTCAAREASAAAARAASSSARSASCAARSSASSSAAAACLCASSAAWACFSAATADWLLRSASSSALRAIASAAAAIASAAAARASALSARLSAASLRPSASTTAVSAANARCRDSAASSPTFPRRARSTVASARSIRSVLAASDPLSTIAPASRTVPPGVISAAAAQRSPTGVCPAELGVTAAAASISSRITCSSVLPMLMRRRFSVCGVRPIVCCPIGVSSGLPMRPLRTVRGVAAIFWN